MSTLRFERLRPLLAPPAVLAAALLASPSLGQDAAPAGPPLYRVEVVVFQYGDGNPTEELFAHTAAQAAAPAADVESETFDFSPYVREPESGLPDDPFGAEIDDPTSAEDRRSQRRLLDRGDTAERGAADGGDARTPGGPDAAGDAGAAGDPDGALSRAGDGTLSESAQAGDAALPGQGPATDPDVEAETPPADPLGPGVRNAAASFRFRLLAPDELRLVDAHGRLERLDAYTPLLHGGWIQEGLPLEDARPFDLAYLGASNPSGSIRLHLSRYLHLTLDLVYRPDAPPLRRRSLGDAAAPAAGNDDGDGAMPPRFEPRGRLGARPGTGERGFGELPPAAFGAPDLSDLALPARYVLRAERRIGSGTLQYFDHPMFGVLVLVEPYEPPASAESDSVGPAA